MTRSPATTLQKLLTKLGACLTGIWLGVLLMLGIDVYTSPFPRLIVGAMFWFCVFAAAGIAWRRFWKQKRIDLNNADMKRHVTRDYETRPIHRNGLLKHD